MDTKIGRGGLLIEGKTKRVFLAEGQDNMVICEYKNTITAHNDPTRTRDFEGKGADSNTVNCRVFELLNRAGIPTAFVEQLSPSEFLALKCRMVPLEVVARRCLVGSYLKVEFGITPDGKLVVADVIDSDSWRLLLSTEDEGWKDVSKQSFRDGDELDTVRAKYALVAELAQQLDV